MTPRTPGQVLRNLSKQRLWDNAMKVLTQDDFAYRDESCMYNDGEGRHCAIGHSIPDDVYNHCDPIEQHGVTALMHTQQLSTGHKVAFASLMQHNHDVIAATTVPVSVRMANFYYMMLDVADSASLEYPDHYTR